MLKIGQAAPMFVLPDADMEDIDIATANTGSTVYLVCSVKFVDAMEDLTLRVNM